MKQDKVTEDKLKHYFELTKTAFEMAMASREKIDLKDAREQFLDMSQRYIQDANHFYEHGDYLNAFAALNYAHGWLDAGARLGIFDVHDSRYFAND